MEIFGKQISLLKLWMGLNFPRTCWSDSNRQGFDVSTGCGSIKRDWIVKDSLNNLINSVEKLWYFIRVFIENLNFFNFLRKHFLVNEKKDKRKRENSSTSFEYGNPTSFLGKRVQQKVNFRRLAGFFALAKNIFISISS